MPQTAPQNRPMKLYMAPLAPNPERVTMFVAEKGGIDGLEMVKVDIMAGDHRNADYRAKSPLSQVPSLELEDGRTLTESRAICAYLEGIKPEPNLMGEGFEERAFIEMWDRRIELSFFVHLAGWVRHGHPALVALETKQLPQWAEVSEARTRAACKWIDARLGESEFIAGDRFTIADITAFAAFGFARLLRFAPWDEHSNIARWRDVMKTRPCARREKV